MRTIADEKRQRRRRHEETLSGVRFFFFKIHNHWRLCCVVRKLSCFFGLGDVTQLRSLNGKITSPSAPACF